MNTITEHVLSLMFQLNVGTRRTLEAAAMDIAGINEALSQVAQDTATKKKQSSAPPVDPKVGKRIEELEGKE